MEQADSSLSIGIEIGGTKTQVGVGTSDGKLLPKGILRRQVVQERGARGILDNLVSMVEGVLSSHHINLSDIHKIGIGFGGPIDSARGVVLQSFQIDGWANGNGENLFFSKTTLV